MVHPCSLKEFRNWVSEEFVHFCRNYWRFPWWAFQINPWRNFQKTFGEITELFLRGLAAEIFSEISDGILGGISAGIIEEVFETVQGLIGYLKKYFSGYMKV